MIISGEPVTIWHAPASAAPATGRWPPLQARSASSTTHGIQARAAMWQGHIQQCRASPFQAKIRPAKLAARRLPNQRKARKYIPIPARKTWPRMKKFIAQGIGSNS